MAIADGGFIGPRATPADAGSEGLSPWPATDAARNTLRRAFGGTESDSSVPPDDVVDRLGGAAAALVEAHAPGAPQAVKDEAVIRCAAWMKSSPPNELFAISTGGDDMAFRPLASRNALRASGAAGLLAPWRKPRSRVLEDDS